MRSRPWRPSLELSPARTGLECRETRCASPSCPETCAGIRSCSGPSRLRRLTSAQLPGSLEHPPLGRPFQEFRRVVEGALRRSRPPTTCSSLAFLPQFPERRSGSSKCRVVRARASTSCVARVCCRIKRYSQRVCALEIFDESLDLLSSMIVKPSTPARPERSRAGFNMSNYGSVQRIDGRFDFS